MSKDKKLFDSEDFDKQKKLFTSEDFNKQAESGNDTTGDVADKKGKDNNALVSAPTGNNWKKVACGIVAAAAVIGGIIIIPNIVRTNKPVGTPPIAIADATQHKGASENDSTKQAVATTKTDSISNGTSDSEATNPSNVNETNSVTSEVQKTEENIQSGSDENIEGSTQALANDVIAGKYANWPERERKLGKRYKEIQSKVNEMYRKGLVK